MAKNFDELRDELYAAHPEARERVDREVSRLRAIEGRCGVCSQPCASGELVCLACWAHVDLHLAAEYDRTMALWKAGALDIEALREVQKRVVQDIRTRAPEHVR